ncbi:hypothetical protein NFX31_14315 [Microbacterium azadirachtae]|uniref:Secreted protein n=1 Tax=Microbacterium azadirachtae TaxID=582680 RepID=A0A0F0L1Z2_9MICO|nr:hypothetical protein [Microbacterium azadirachtae]KJL27162.1 hypothetical protein RL72_00630 [Microbacterium azadirachtae]UXW85367.1 hypothetical protein NFX31_14315 [Microbacterium azadirachtae]
MRTKKKFGLAIAAAFALVIAVPAAASADSGEGAPPSDTSDLAAQIANAPDLRYVSVAEAVEEFGFDPSAPVESTPSSDESGLVLTPMNEWWGCEWDGKADYPHVTNGEASVHGYWVYKSGSCPSTADITANLQALGCSSLGCTWITQATGTATAVTPGSGTGHWATPHKACANSNPVGWRGEVYVGLTNFWHPYGPSYGAQVDLSCSPA